MLVTAEVVDYTESKTLVLVNNVLPFWAIISQHASKFLVSCLSTASAEVRLAELLEIVAKLKIVIYFPILQRKATNTRSLAVCRNPIIPCSSTANEEILTLS